MEEKNKELIRNAGNHLMGEFVHVLSLLEEAEEESEKDILSNGEESRRAGEKKYALLEQCDLLTEQLKRDYLDFADLMGFNADSAGWDFPFNEEFKNVDIELDNQVVDRYFDLNLRNVYIDMRKSMGQALEAFHKTMGELNYICPCCGMSYFEKNGSYEICPVCGWENDRVQNSDPTFRGGANKDCLMVARKKFEQTHRIRRAG